MIGKTPKFHMMLGEWVSEMNCIHTMIYNKQESHNNVDGLLGPYAKLKGIHGLLYTKFWKISTNIDDYRKQIPGSQV